MESEVWLEEAGHQVGDHKEPTHCRPRSMEPTYHTLPPLQPHGEMHRSSPKLHSQVSCRRDEIAAWNRALEIAAPLHDSRVGKCSGEKDHHPFKFISEGEGTDG